MMFLDESMLSKRVGAKEQTRICFKSFLNEGHRVTKKFEDLKECKQSLCLANTELESDQDNFGDLDQGNLDNLKLKKSL